MTPLGMMGKFLVILGIALVLLGVFLMVAPRIPWIGHLPGDIVIRKKNTVIYFPLVTSLLISLILTILFNIFRS